MYIQMIKWVESKKDAWREKLHIQSNLLDFLKSLITLLSDKQTEMLVKKEFVEKGYQEPLKTL